MLFLLSTFEESKIWFSLSKIFLILSSILTIFSSSSINSLLLWVNNKIWFLNFSISFNNLSLSFWHFIKFFFKLSSSSFICLISKFFALKSFCKLFIVCSQLFLKFFSEFKLLNEIEKFKNHIVLLTQSNKELMEELENIVNADDKVRNILDKENQILVSSNVENRNINS